MAPRCRSPNSPVCVLLKKHILNAPTNLMKSAGYGRGYAYDHDTEEAFSGQNYFPDALPRQRLITRRSAASSAIL